LGHGPDQLHADFGQFLAYRQVALGSLVWLGWLGGDGVHGSLPFRVART
jgi:hypothetical protein